MRNFKHLMLVSFIAALSMNSLAFAHGKSENQGGKSKGSENRTYNYRIQLNAIEGVATLARANIKYQVKAKQERRRLSAKLKIPLPSSIPAIADEAGALAADLRLEFSRADVPYALCYLAFDEVEIDDEDASLEAEYKLDLETRVKHGETREKFRKGSCDIDLLTDAVQAGVPDLQDGDIIKARIVSGDVGLDFLQGQK